MARRGSSQADGTKGAATKGAGGRGGGAAGAEKQGRLKQIRLVFGMTRKRDPKMIWWVLLAFFIPVAVGVGVGFLLSPLWLWTAVGVIFGFVLALNIFGRRAQRSAFTEMEGQPGAGASVIERMRGDFRLTTPVQINRNQDLVSRVVCRAGVILVAEGRGRGPRELLGAEVRRVKRVAGDVPLHDIIVGNGEGEVPLAKLQSTIMRKRRVLRRNEVDDLYRRLAALGAMNLPIPKGPMPTRIPRGGKNR